MKNKNVAALTAFFGGFIGLHRFYLGQIGLGVVYAFLFFTGISFILGILDGIIFLTMNQQVFDAKYNKRYGYLERRMDTDFQRPASRRPSRQAERYQRRPKSVTPVRRPAARTRRRVKNNPFKQAGIKKFKEFDIEAAIEDFQQALKIDPNDLSIHFNLACAYSQTEKAENAYEHISKAVEMGFNDFDRIDTHDALAFVRIQPQWEEFKANGYTLRKRLASPQENLLDNDLLLQQLKKLNELKNKGLITEKEFIDQKSKLTRQ
ncbi:MAG: NINE protein [Saprospiraceae bacterium]|nr:NINE protein [Saprospiraceae bacterium]